MHELVAGVDEAGRGPLAGPVVAAAVILDPENPIAGLRDSKKLSAKQREKLSAEIQSHAIAWAIAQAEVEEIDNINILQASLLAMQRAVQDLTEQGFSTQIQRVLVDGNRCPNLPYPAEAIIKGDMTEPAISAASILAKVARDQMMEALHEQYPVYEFNKHKGYPTVRHRQLLGYHGPCPSHRRSFAPVARSLRLLEA